MSFVFGGPSLRSLFDLLLCVLRGPSVFDHLICLLCCAFAVRLESRSSAPQKGRPVDAYICWLLEQRRLMFFKDMAQTNPVYQRNVVIGGHM